ncbi:helix-turn-helix domain-containing protein, partial [Patescibacteria group bacterium]|nr:helix-turn-helix domain-containing protein [Patescibacteria group bacterium]
MTENDIKLLEEKTGKKWLSMLEASKRCSYSQEYLSLLARKGKIFSQKIGRNWYTTEEALKNYLQKQNLIFALPKKIISRLTAQANLVAALTPEEPEEEGEGIKTGHEGHSKIFEEFERLNPQLFPRPRQGGAEGGQTKKSEDLSAQAEKFSKEAIIQPPPQAESQKPELQTEKIGNTQKDVLTKLDKLSGSLELFAERVTRKLNEPAQEPLTSEQEEFFDMEIPSFTHRFKIFDRYARSMMRNPVRMITIMITAVVAIFIIAGGFSFGQADYVVQQIKKAFTDADTVQGHFPGTHANEVLVLDKAGNVSIFGHIETHRQLRSFAPDGVAAIVV